MRTNRFILIGFCWFLLMGCNLLFGSPADQAEAGPVVQPDLPTLTPSGNTFSGDGFSLRYPADWKPVNEIFGLSPRVSHNSEFDADEVFSVGEPGEGNVKMGAYCKLLALDLAPEVQMEAAMTNAYAVLDAYPDAEIMLREIQVNGQAGIEKIYRRPSGEPWYQVRDVWFQRGQRVWILSCWTYPAAFETDVNDFDILLNSLSFQ